MSANNNPTPAVIEILAVEDSPTQAQWLKNILEQQGYRVALAGDGRQALTLLGERKPALIISDIVMPGMNGYELCKILKAEEKTRDIPVILLTSLSNPEDVLEGLACGADSFITKPYSTDYLLAHIQQMLANWKLRKNDLVRVGVEILYAGKRRFISADQQQMLGLLLSTYEAAVQRNSELVQTQAELNTLNEELENKVKERTAALSAENIERKRAEDEVRHRLSELEVLYASSLEVSQLHHPKEIGQKIIDILFEKLQWHHATLRLYHPESEVVELLAFRQPDLGNKADQLTAEEQFKNRITRPGQGLAGWVIQSGQSVYCGDVTKDPRYIEAWPEIRSGMYVPLQVGERTIGCLSIESTRVNAFTETDEWLITTLAAQAAGALENARLFEETNRRLKQVQALHMIDTAINSSLDLHLTLDVFLDQVMNQLGVDAADVLLFNPDARTLECAGRHGFRTDALQYTHLRLGEGYAGMAAADRKTIHIPDVRRRKTDFLRSPNFLSEGFITCFFVSLIAKGELKGVLEVFLRSSLEADPEWLDFLETLAGQAAIVIDNATLFRNLQKANLELSLAYDATIDGWSKALDLRDHETEGHTQRVTEMTELLATAMGVGANELVHIHRGALLHDIGKMGVPDDILRKPDKLTPEEWQVMRQHPQLAYDMLAPIAYLRPALDVPYCHHEKWDGTGYPRGLKGEEIPLAARIFAVVDVYDALTSDRPYRKAWPKEQAINYIREQAGAYFDPKVAEIFLQKAPDF